VFFWGGGEGCSPRLLDALHGSIVQDFHVQCFRCVLLNLRAQHTLVFFAFASAWLYSLENILCLVMRDWGLVFGLPGHVSTFIPYMQHKDERVDTTCVTVWQFGKCSDDTFTMDYSYPLCALQVRKRDLLCTYNLASTCMSVNVQISSFSVRLSCSVQLTRAPTRRVP
jgi:hypothetical protein